MAKPPMTQELLEEERDGAQMTPAQRRAAEGAPSARAEAAAGAAVRAARDKPATALKARPVQRNEFHLIEAKQTDWAFVASAGAQPECYDGKPEMWTMVSDMVHAYDTVRVVARDESWWALYLVTSAGMARADAKLLMATELPSKTSTGSVGALPAGYDVRAGDPSQDPWIVVRLADGFIMNQGQFHKTYEDARRWLFDHPIFRSEGTAQYLP